MTEKKSPLCPGYFLLLRNKKTYLDGLTLAAYAATGRMAEKIAKGYFLLLRNKKQLILMRPGLRTGHMGVKKQNQRQKPLVLL